MKDGIMANIELNQNTKALIFDCDGTLVDSMPVHLETWEKTISSLGAKFSYDFFDSVKGMKGRDIVALFNDTFDTKLDPLETSGLKHKLFREQMHRVQPIEQVVKLAVENHKILPMAVVSGGSREDVVGELKHTGIDHLFDVILTADDDFKPKPAPDLFLQAAKILNVKPEECQVFEDGDLGIEAAEKAGMIITDVRKYL